MSKYKYKDPFEGVLDENGTWISNQSFNVLHGSNKPAWIPGVPSGTGLPCAASIRGCDRNYPELELLGACMRFSKIKDGKRYFICKVGLLPAQEIAEENIELAQDWWACPVNGWPEPGNVAP